jgi:hypothetical protein
MLSASTAAAVKPGVFASITDGEAQLSEHKL